MPLSRIRPGAGVRYMTGSVDRFTEVGNGINLSVNEQELQSLILELGVNFEYDIRKDLGLVGHLGYMSDFEDSDNTVAARFDAAGAAGRQFGVNAPGVDDEAFVLGLGGYYDFIPGARLTVNYRVEQRAASQVTHTFGIGANYGF